jgi:hypothetical protein
LMSRELRKPLARSIPATHQVMWIKKGTIDEANGTQ